MDIVIIDHMKFVFTVVAFLLLTNSFSSTAAPEDDDPYKILGVESTVSDERLTEAWRRLMKIHHPDSGGNLKAAQNITEAYQFLRADRTDYDRGILPFRGQFKAVGTSAVPYTYEEEIRYQMAFARYLGREDEAWEMAEERERPVFMLYAMLNLAGDHVGYTNFKSAQLRAYTQLLIHLGLLRMTKSELWGFALHDPVQALKEMIEHYDNFNIRLSTLTEIFMAYDKFYLQNQRKSQEFLIFMEGLADSGLIKERRFDGIRQLIIESLKSWLNYYLKSPRAFRQRHKEQYDRTRALVLRLEPFSKSMRTCFWLLLNIPP